MNKIILIGNLGADPESRTTSTGTTVVNLSLATNRKWKNSDGELQERTDWHRITVWGRTAEIAQQYLAKGRQVCIEGRVEYSKVAIEDTDPVEYKYYTDIVCERLELLGGKNGHDNGGAQAAEQETPF